jgi:CRISPR-associated protein Csb1
VSTLQLPNSVRLLVHASLVPVQGHRFQPTGFPDLGAGRYSLHDGTQMLLVESAQSVANRMESVCWDEEKQQLVDVLQGLPYVEVWDGERLLTNSLLEAHRLNSVYIERSPFSQTLATEIGHEDDKPFDRNRLVRALFKFDPGCLLHGVFLESIAGVLRIPRALSGFIEARNISEVASGGVKNDRVRPGKDKDSGQTAKEGYGNVPFHRTEFTAEHIDAYFNLDIGQLRSYKIGDDAERLLYALSIYKIRAFLERGLRLRTACDFDVAEVRVTRPQDVALPTLAEAEEALGTLIPRVAKQGFFAEPPVSRAQYDPKYEKPKKAAGKPKDTSDQPEESKSKSKPKGKKG